MGVSDCFDPGSENAKCLVAHLVAVTVRTVQQVATPPLADTRHIGQDIAEPGRDEDPPGTQRRAVVDHDLKARFVIVTLYFRRGDADDGSGADLAAVLLDFSASRREEVGWREPSAPR
jgi:hypothetical protein